MLKTIKVLIAYFLLIAILMLGFYILNDMNRKKTKPNLTYCQAAFMKRNE